MAEPALKPLTFDELEDLEDRDGLRYELWGGEPVAMTGGTPTHNLIAFGAGAHDLPASLREPLSVFMPTWGCGSVPPLVVTRPTQTVMIICNLKPEAYQTEPVLVAEVLSEASVGSATAIPSFKAY